LCGVEVSRKGRAMGWWRVSELSYGSIIGEKSGFWNASKVVEAPSYWDMCNYPVRVKF